MIDSRDSISYVLCHTVQLCVCFQYYLSQCLRLFHRLWLSCVAARSSIAVSAWSCSLSSRFILPPTFFSFGLTASPFLVWLSHIAAPSPKAVRLLTCVSSDFAMPVKNSTGSCFVSCHSHCPLSFSCANERKQECWNLHT